MKHAKGSIGRGAKPCAAKPATPVPLSFLELAGAVVSCLDGFGRSDRLVVLWKACFDESYDDHGWFVMAGVVAPMRAWRSFDFKWRRVLREEGKPLEYFTKKDAGRLDQEDSVFYRWSRTAVNKKTAALARVLTDTADTRFLVAFRLTDFHYVMNRTSFGGEEDGDDYKDPYLCGFYASLMITAQFMEALGGRQKKPVLVFDRWDGDKGKKRERLAHEIYDLHLRHPTENPVARWLQSQPLFYDDHRDDGVRRVDRGLQAADLVAWHYRNAFKRASNGEPYMVHRRMGRRVRSYVWGRRSLQNWAWTLKEHLREKRGEPSNAPWARGKKP